jgi:hypothetical protein
MHNIQPIMKPTQILLNMGAFLYSSLAIPTTSKTIRSPVQIALSVYNYNEFWSLAACKCDNRAGY